MSGGAEAATRHAALMAEFDRLCDLPAAERAHALATVRAQDPPLARHLARLLAADARGPDLLDATGGAVHAAADLDGLVLAERWRLVERLGGGGGGEVWRAADLRDGTAAAVKLIAPRLLERPVHVRRFRREFRTLARLEHPGCVRVLAEGQVPADGPLMAARRHYLVMEHVAGGDLMGLVHAPQAARLLALLELATALDYIHRHQIVHRDLKPSNVLLTGDEPPHVKLADFGIVHLERDGLLDVTEQDERGAVGTLDYMSPEQARGRPTDPRSDLYSLGCIVHTLWAGSPPFTGNRMERLWARLERPAPPLAERAADAPTALCRLTDALLSTDPAERPARAYDVAQVVADLLVAAAPSGAHFIAPTLPERAKGAYLYPPGMVGREAAMARLRQVAESVASNRAPRTVAIVAPAGLGKTTLSEALYWWLAEAGWRCVSARLERVGEVPFAPWPALRIALGARPNTDQRSDSPALLDAVPESSAGQPVPAAVAVADERFGAELKQAQRRIARRVLDALHPETAAAATPSVGPPTCILLEDMHLAGKASLGVLDSLTGLAAEAKVPLLLVVTGRPSLRARLETPRFDLVELPPLAAPAVELAVARMLGPSAESVPARLPAALLAETEGSPLLLRAAVRDLVDSGALERVRSGWELREEAAPRQAVRSVLERRLDILSERTRQLLRLAARVGPAFHEDVLAEVAGRSPNDVLEALAESVAAGIVAPLNRDGADAPYLFEHARLAELLAAELPVADLAAIHDRIGTVLAAGGASVHELAYHFGLGSDDERAARYLGEAIDEARAAHDHSAVALYLERLLARFDAVAPGSLALGGASSRSARRELAEARADALLLSGQHVEAAAELAALGEGATDRLERGRLLRKRGAALLRTGQPGQGVMALEGALVELGDRPPRTRLGRLGRLGWDAIAALVARFVRGGRSSSRDVERARAHVELATAYRWIDLYDAAAHLSRLYRLCQRRPMPRDLQVDSNTMAAAFFALRAMPRAAELVQEQARDYATASGDVAGLARLTIYQGLYEVMALDSDIALDRMGDGVRLARESGDPWLLCFAESSRAWVRGIVGSVPVAYEEFRAAAELGRSLGAAWLAADATCGMALAALACGRLDEGEAAARAMLGADVRFAFPVIEELAVEALAGAAFVRGRFADALIGYERALELLRRYRLREGWGWLVPMELLEAATCLADESGARGVPRLRDLLRVARREVRWQSRLPLFRGCDDVVAGVLAARAGRAELAASCFKAGAASRSDTRRSYMDTWVHVRPALERARLGEDRDVLRAELDGVDETYDALGLDGMRQWLAIARANSGV